MSGSLVEPHYFMMQIQNVKLLVQTQSGVYATQIWSSFIFLPNQEHMFN